MSEPESLDTDETLPKRMERHWFDRLIMLSDGVFAIAMTLLALEVRPPAGWTGGLDDLLEKIWRPLFGYGLSFLIVGLFWFANRSIMARVRRVDGRFSALTLFFLFLIGLTPFATALMAQYGPARSMKVYSILVGPTGGAQALLWSYVAFWQPLLDPEVSRRERWLTLATFLTMPVAFGVAGLLVHPGSSEFVLLPVVAAAAVLGQMRRKLMRSM
ncbi:MAG: TMEM175 family protein [Pseudomonadota bacterium]|nr:TMEM175 family protein [Pseudomonadota bacterium]